MLHSCLSAMTGHLPVYHLANYELCSLSPGCLSPSMQCAKGSADVWLCLPLNGMQKWLLARPHDIAVRNKCEHACDCMQLGVIHPTASVQACATAEGQSPCCFPSACLCAWCVSSDCLPPDCLAPDCLSPGCFCVSPAKPVSMLLSFWLSASLLCVNYMPSHRLAACRGCFPPVCL